MPARARSLPPALAAHVRRVSESTPDLTAEGVERLRDAVRTARAIDGGIA